MENITASNTTPVEHIDGQLELLHVEPVKVELQVPEVVRMIVEEFELAEFTCYQVHNVLNSAFAVLGSSKTIRPQMMYNYSSNGLINGIKAPKQKFTPAEVIKFATKFVTKHTQNAS